jgi:hypothetical protein
MLGCASTSLALAFALARGAGPAPAPVRVEPPARTPTKDHVRRPEPSPATRSARPLDPAALQARVQTTPRSADLRNPFQHADGATAVVDTTPPRDLKDPFAQRRPTPPATVPVAISPDLHNPFARKAKPKADAARSERPTPPPTPACTTAKGVPVQRPRAVRSTAPPCPARTPPRTASKPVAPRRSK